MESAATSQFPSSNTQTDDVSIRPLEVEGYSIDKAISLSGDHELATRIASVSHIIVGGTYKVHVFSFNFTTARHISNKDCPKRLHGYYGARFTRTKRVGIGKFQYIILAISGMATLAMVLENQNMAYALPMAKCDLQMTTSEQGLIGTVVFIGVLLSSHFWGFMTDTWGRVRTLRLTLLLTCIASAVSSMSWQTWMLIVTRFFVGLASAGIKISAVAYLGEFFDTDQRLRYFALLSSIGTTAYILQPLLGMAILTLSFESSWFPGFVYRPWRLFVLLGSLITGLTAVIMFFLPEGPAFSVLVGKQRDALNTLQSIYHMNTGRPKKDYEVKEISTLSENKTNLQRVKTVKEALNLLWNQTWPLFSTPYRSDMILLSVLTFFAFSISQGLYIWYPQILVFFEGRTNLPSTVCQTIELTNQPKSLDTLKNLTMMTITTPEVCKVSFDVSSLNWAIILGAVMITLNLILAFTIKALGKTNVIIAWFTLNTIGAIGLIWADNYYAIMVLMIFVITTSALTNNYISFSSDLFATQYKGMAISLMFMSARTGSIVGGNLIGAMLYTACSSLMILIAVILFCCTILSYYILRKSEKNQRFKSINSL